MATVRILHLVRPEVRVRWEDWNACDIRSALVNGQYYEAGVIETDADYFYNEGEDRMDYSPILRDAFDRSQNEAAESEVVGYSGGMVQFASPKWNGKFSQRSTSPGDLMVIDGGMVFQVLGDGYRYITSYRALNKLRNIKLAVNPKALNEDFDQLITD